MAECGWKGPFDTPCHFTAGHGSAHSQMGGSEDDRYGNTRQDRESRHHIFDRRQHADTRTVDQKLEAMAAPGSGATEGERRNAEHLLFKRRQKAATEPKQKVGNPGGVDPWERANTVPNSDDPQTMSYADFRKWTQRQQHRSSFSAEFPKGFHGSDPKPHVYTASRGDALGCDTCARSKDNKHANHIKQVG